LECPTPFHIAMFDRRFSPITPGTDIRRRDLIRAAGSAALGVALAPIVSLVYADPAPDLSSVRLVLGEQARGLQSLVEAADVLKDTPYQIKWANFQGAAPLFEAQRAGAVDLAPAGDLPVLAAALGDPDLKIVATVVSSGAVLGILVPPSSAVHAVKDLKGKTVVVSSARGSISQYQLYGALAEAGLSYRDVNVKFVLPIDAAIAFQNGNIDVWATFDPYYGSAVAGGARVIRDGVGISSGLDFITASSQAVADPLKRAAINDVLLRFRQAGRWAYEHPDDYARIYSALTHLPFATARPITARSALRLHAVTQADIGVMQKLADVSFSDGILPRRIDVAPLCVTDLHLPTTV